MHALYIAAFDNLRTKEGHFLWPRFLETADAVLLAKIQWLGPGPMPQDHERQTLPIFQNLVRDAFDKAHLEFREPAAFGLFDPDKIPADDIELRAIYDKLTSSDRTYIFSVNPPEGMTPDEKLFYREQGF